MSHSPSPPNGALEAEKGTGLSLTLPTTPADSSTTELDRPSQKRRKVSVTSASSTAAVDASGRLTAKKMPQAWKGIKVKRGSLKDFVDMPVDILLEVFSHLSVGDLHTLSLSSKALRAMLLNRTMCLTLWKDAFTRLQPTPPPCPMGVALPQYASFLFSRECFTCNRKTGLSRSFECLCVCCKECILTEFINLRDTEGLETTAISITPRYHVKRPERPRGSREPFRPDYEKHRAILRNFETEREKLAYVKEEQARIEDRKKHFGTFYMWSFGQKRSKVVDQNDRRASREQEIMGRLRELGYDDVLQKLDRNLPIWRKRAAPERSALIAGFASVKPLTDREWGKMKETLVARAEALRKKQEEQDRLTLILTRTDSLAAAYRSFLDQNPDLKSFAPPVQQLAKLEPFQAAIYDIPEDEDEQAVAVFNSGELYRPVLVAWSALAEEGLRKLLPWNSVTADAHDVLLDFCTFKCTLCGVINIPYPRALTHDCLFLTSLYPELDVRQRDTNVTWNFNQGPGQLEYDDSEHRHSIATAYGLPFNIRSCKDLDEFDASGMGGLLKCVRCEGRFSCRSWREAAKHEISTHYLTATNWRRYSLEEPTLSQSVDNDLLDSFSDMDDECGYELWW